MQLCVIIIINFTIIIIKFMTLQITHGIYLNCVFPTPGAPQSSVIFPSGTPPPSMLSTFAEKVTMYPCCCSALNNSRAETPPLELHVGLDISDCTFEPDDGCSTTFKISSA